MQYKIRKAVTLTCNGLKYWLKICGRYCGQNEKKWSLKMTILT